MAKGIRLVTLTAILSACTSNPTPGSLAALYAEAQHSAFVACLQTMHGQNRNVPGFMLRQACRAQMR